jgi:GH25 family lysozyme M1 (1,4-beta-N-acetylmuramidase)
MATEGVDVSKYQSGYDPNVGFVIVRLGANLTTDPLASQHVAFAKTHNIPVGGYWVVYEAASGAQQANACWSVMKALGVSRVAVDAEQFKGTSILTLNTVIGFVGRMKVLNGDCGIYSGYWIKAHGGGTCGADWGWLANYTAFDLPSGWSPAFTVLWQYTTTPIDRNKYLGRVPVADFF